MRDECRGRSIENPSMEFEEAMWGIRDVKAFLEPYREYTHSPALSR